MHLLDLFKSCLKTNRKGIGVGGNPMEKIIDMSIFTALVSNTYVGYICEEITSSFINRNTFPNLQ